MSNENSLLFSIKKKLAGDHDETKIVTITCADGGTFVGTAYRLPDLKLTPHNGIRKFKSGEVHEGEFENGYLKEGRVELAGNAGSLTGIFKRSGNKTQLVKGTQKITKTQTEQSGIFSHGCLVKGVVKTSTIIQEGEFIRPKAGVIQLHKGTIVKLTEPKYTFKGIFPKDEAQEGCRGTRRYESGRIEEGQFVRSPNNRNERVLVCGYCITGKYETSGRRDPRTHHLEEGTCWVHVGDDISTPLHHLTHGYFTNHESGQRRTTRGFYFAAHSSCSSLSDTKADALEGKETPNVPESSILFTYYSGVSDPVERQLHKGLVTRVAWTQQAIGAQKGNGGTDQEGGEDTALTTTNRLHFMDLESGVSLQEDELKWETSGNFEPKNGRVRRTTPKMYTAPGWPLTPLWEKLVSGPCLFQLPFLLHIWEPQGAPQQLTATDQLAIERAFLRDDKECTLPCSGESCAFTTGGAQPSAFLKQTRLQLQRRELSLAESITAYAQNITQDEQEMDPTRFSVQYPLLPFSYRLHSEDYLLTGNMKPVEEYSFEHSLMIERSMVAPVAETEKKLPSSEDTGSKETSQHWIKPPIDLSFFNSKSTQFSFPGTYPVSRDLVVTGEHWEDDVFLHAVPRQVVRKFTAVDAEGKDDNKKNSKKFVLDRVQLQPSEIISSPWYVEAFITINAAQVIFSSLDDTLEIPQELVVDSGIASVQTQMRQLAHYFRAVAIFSEDLFIAKGHALCPPHFREKNHRQRDANATAVRFGAVSSTALYAVLHAATKWLWQRSTTIDLPEEWEKVADDDEDEDALLAQEVEDRNAAAASSDGDGNMNEELVSLGAPHSSILMREASSIESRSSAPAPNFLLFTLKEGTTEYAAVSTYFLSSGFKPSIARIQRVQNRQLYENYVLKKRQVAKENGGDSNEVRWMAHGTRGTDPLLLCEAGFDHRYAEPGFYGRASYFAYNVSYSHAFRHNVDESIADEPPQSAAAASSSSSSKKMMLGQIVLACVCRGQVEVRKEKDNTIVHPAAGCHSVEGPVSTGQLAIMVYDLFQAYPAYLVTYKFPVPRKKK